MFDAASVLIPYHIFLAGALVAAAVFGAVIRAVVKKKNPLSADVFMEYVVMFILLAAYVVLVARKG